MKLGLALKIFCLHRRFFIFKVPTFDNFNAGNFSGFTGDDSSCGLFGLASTLPAAILSTTSMPEITCPKTVYCPSRKGEPPFYKHR